MNESSAANVLSWSVPHVLGANIAIGAFNRIRDDRDGGRDRRHWSVLRSIGDDRPAESLGLTMVEPNNNTDDLPDDIVEDIRAVRRAHAAAFGFDVARIVADLRKKDAESGDQLVSLPPKPTRRRRVAAGE